MSKDIEHNAIVKQITSNAIIVEIQTNGACDGCHAKGSCGGDSNKTRLITIEDTSAQLQIGQQVRISMTESAGMYSVLLAYLLPTVLLLISMFITLEYLSEPLAVLISFFLVTLYYILLYRKRHVIKKRIVCKLVM